MIDLHSHIIPFIDDGASNIQESLEMLKCLKQQGVNTVVATPHYMSEEYSVEEFIEIRKDCFEQTKREIRETNSIIPSIILGAEVYLTPEMQSLSNLESLCIENTRCILIEMPYTNWYDWMYDAIYRIITEKKLIPVIAHVERYFSVVSNPNRIQKLLEMDVFPQVNAQLVIENSMRKIASMFFENELLTVIGSDAHNIGDRKPQMKEAREKIIKRFGIAKFDFVMKNASGLLDNKRD